MTETVVLSEEMHVSLIQQLHMVASMHGHCARANRIENPPLSLQGIVLRHGVGRICKADRWFGIKRGQMKACYTNATKLVMSDPERFVYMEGYGVRPSLGMVIGEHAWVLDRERDFEVVDPTWRNTKGSAYLGIPFSFEYLCRQLSETGYYGLLDTYWSGWPVRRLPCAEWLHQEAGQLPRDFTVPDDLEDPTVGLEGIKMTLKESTDG